jgi:hypothetical protein
MDGPLPAITVPGPAGPAPERIRSTASPAAPAEREPPTGEQDQAAMKQEAGNRRGRRFVLPPDDEDRGRTERAIEAFLGEPAPSGSTSAHRPRRRARRQRAPGEAPAPIVLVAALGGYDELRNTLGREGAARFAEAYGEALRATLRSGDHVTDLGQGRLRLVVHADEDGARALMDRARAVCQPWLRLAPVPLALRVRPMPEARPADARRGDGRTNGSAPSIEARSGSQPDDVVRRRLAAG